MVPIWGGAGTKERILLNKVETKSFKSSDSSVTKLLAKKEAVAFTLLDKVGMRFVTKHLFDAFRVLRYLVTNHLVSFPHNIPDQSNNTLYPLDLFMESLETLISSKKYSLEELDEVLISRLAASQDKLNFNRKLNDFSGQDYRFIKFISRRLIEIEMKTSSEGGEPKRIHFFYPYEIQIVDYNTYLKNLSGEASHEEYKKRQKRRAYLRVFGRSEKN